MTSTFGARYTPIRGNVFVADAINNRMPPDGFPPGSPAPPTDGAFFHPARVPIVNMLAAPM
jgi:hypothetical protein